MLCQLPAELEDPTEAPARAVVDALATESIDPDTAVARWRPATDPVERVRLLVEFLMGDTIGAQRLAAFSLIRGIDGTDATVFADVERLAAQGLSDEEFDAAMYLLERGLATGEEVGDFLSVDTLIDLLASTLGDSEALAGLFMSAQPSAEGDLVDEMWCSSVEETTEVLEAIGRHVPNKALAKAARKGSADEAGSPTCDQRPSSKWPT